MAADPTIRLQHIWHALMRVLGPTHFGIRQANRLFQKDIRRNMRRH